MKYSNNDIRDYCLEMAKWNFKNLDFIKVLENNKQRYTN